MKREAVLIVPSNDNSGQPIPEILDRALRLCDRAFGGVTLTQGTGQWQGQREPVNLLTSAMESSADNDRKLRIIAMSIGRLAAQQAMYVRYANGDVDILDVQ